jgi:hypothetical protein
VAGIQQNHVLTGTSQNGTASITSTASQQDHRLIAATALVAASLTPVAFTQIHSLIASGVSVSTAITVASLVQSYNLTLTDLAVLVEMEEAQFLHGLQNGTIRLVDESWVVVEYRASRSGSGGSSPRPSSR